MNWARRCWTTIDKFQKCLVVWTRSTTESRAPSGRGFWSTDPACPSVRRPGHRSGPWGSTERCIQPCPPHRFGNLRLTSTLRTGRTSSKYDIQRNYRRYHWLLHLQYISLRKYFKPGSQSFITLGKVLKGIGWIHVFRNILVWNRALREEGPLG